MQYGIGGAILLALAIFAIWNVLTSATPGGTKVLWIILILFLPLIGFIIWLVAGPRGGGTRI